jgi:hypothetical protein
MQHLQSLIENLRWLLVIGAVFLVLLVLTVIIVTVTRLTGWSFSVWFSRLRYRYRRYQRDGTPYPPASPGICDRCRQAREVFHLPDGRRLCRPCYRKATLGLKT